MKGLNKPTFSEEEKSALRQLLKTDKIIVLYPNALYEVKGDLLIKFLQQINNNDYGDYCCWYISREFARLIKFVQ